MLTAVQAAVQLGSPEASVQAPELRPALPDEGGLQHVRSKAFALSEWQAIRTRPCGPRAVAQWPSVDLSASRLPALQAVLLPAPLCEPPPQPASTVMRRTERHAATEYRTYMKVPSYVCDHKRRAAGRSS